MTLIDFRLVDPLDQIPLSFNAKLAHEAELATMREVTPTERHKYWRRYADLAEELFFKGLTRSRLGELGGELRSGVTMPVVDQAAHLGRLICIGESNAEIASIGRALQRVISFNQSFS